MDERSDAELVSHTRDGGMDAFAVLYLRHRPVMRGAARRIVRRSEVDDVVADAFAATLEQVRRGRGPTTSVRAYLLTAVRREAWRRSARDRRVLLGEDVDSLVDPGTTTGEHDEVEAAFRALPRRWRLVLWQLEVEGRRPRDLADELGLTPNAVAALGYRARVGLRAAYGNRSAA